MVGITATATSDDLDASGGTLTFPRGTLETWTIQIPFKDDGVREVDEKCEVRLGDPSAGVFVVGSTIMTTITIPAHGGTEQAPTSANGTVTTGADADYGFAVADFNFSDANADALSSVKIVTLPGRGVLKLDGANVRAGQSVTPVQLNDGDLTYTPPRGHVGGACPISPSR